MATDAQSAERRMIMRLIDADRALEIVRDQGIAHPNAYHLTNYATLILREAPTVDAVEVVRRKYCIKCYDTDECPMCFVSDGKYYEYTNGNGYCDRGERIEE